MTAEKTAYDVVMNALDYAMFYEGAVSPHGMDGPSAERAAHVLAGAVLDALAADRWAVVRTPFVKAYPWEPVPEGSEQ